jgi:chemotaxis protein methyltransferase CheR
MAGVMPMRQAARIAADFEIEVQLLSDILIEYCGLGITQHRRESTLRYVRARLEAMGLGSIGEYCRHLRHAATGRAELNALVQRLTVNETYFFREAHQFQLLVGGDVLPPAEEGRRIRVLSAGCSSGEEAYSLIIHAQEAGFRTSAFELSVEAFDIHPDRVAAAQAGVYRRPSLRVFGPETPSRYFDFVDDERVSIRERYRSGLRFSVGNVLDLNSFPSGGAFDAIFCRNVFIYFNERSLRQAIANFACCLKPGGALFLGHSESIIGLTADFRPARIGNHIIYRRAERLSGRSLATAWGLL